MSSMGFGFRLTRPTSTQLSNERLAERGPLAMRTDPASDFAAPLHGIGSDVAALAPFRAWSRG